MHGPPPPSRTTRTGLGALQVRVLGLVEAVVDGTPVRIAGRKPRALLAMLAMHPGQTLSVDRLIDGLWGDESPDSAANALQVYIGQLRRDLAAAGARVRTVGQAYELDVTPESVDALAFERAVEQARSASSDAGAWQGALNLWAGDPFANLPPAPFMTSLIARLTETRDLAVDERVEADLAQGRHHELIPELEASVADRPYRERTWRQLMLALYLDGRQADALATFRRAEAVLADELGLDPGPALAALEHAILNQDPALQPTRPAAIGIRLPEPPSRLVGRERELLEVRAAVGGQRLTTLLGPGGVGKTRLAIEVGAGLGSEFPEGVVFVDLTGASDRVQIPSEVARACGVRSDAPLDDLAAAIGAGRILLLLDNLEQISDAGLALRDLLAAMRGVHVLATSRVALRVRGEHVVPIEPLGAEAGVELFRDRLTAGRADTPDGSLLQRAVQRLDGLPLAIELAAASARTLAVTELLRRLEEGIPLPGRQRDLPARQQTIEATLHWSADLLSEAALRLWPIVASFASPFTVDVAARVTDADVADALSELVDASLLTIRGGRYAMLETVRQHATALVDAPTHGSILDRHAEWVLETAVASERLLHSSSELEARATLAAILPDLRAGADRLVSTGRLEDAGRLLVATSNMWYHEGLSAELRERLDRVLAGTRGDADGVAEARVLRAVLGKLAGETGSHEALAGALAPLRASRRDSVVVANGLCHLADLEAEAGHAETAFQLADEAVDAAHRTGDAGSVVMALDLSSYVAQVLGDADRAIDASQAALRVAADGPTPQRINAMAGLATALHRGGRATEAVDAAWLALAEAEQQGTPIQTAEVVLTVAEVIVAHDPHRSGDRLAAALATFLAFGARRNAVVTGAALVRARASVAPVEAARLLGGLEARAADADGIGLGEVLGNLRAVLGAERLAGERASGRQLSDDGLARAAAALGSAPAGLAAGG
jgi:predicted ATPase/DNA-binding SARP family transcriptional activator